MGVATQEAAQGAARREYMQRLIGAGIQGAAAVTGDVMTRSPDAATGATGGTGAAATAPATTTAATGTTSQAQTAAPTAAPAAPKPSTGTAPVPSAAPVATAATAPAAAAAQRSLALGGVMSPMDRRRLQLGFAPETEQFGVGRRLGGM
jgi:hypothetical protein